MQGASPSGCDCEHGSRSLCDAVLEFCYVQAVAAFARLEKSGRAAFGRLLMTMIVGRLDIAAGRGHWVGSHTVLHGDRYNLLPSIPSKTPLTLALTLIVWEHFCVK